MSSSTQIPTLQCILISAAVSGAPGCNEDDDNVSIRRS